MRVDWCVSSWFRIKNTHSHTTYVYLHSTTATTATARSAEENFGASRAAAGVDAVVSQLGRGGRPCVSLRSVENH